MAVPEHGLEAMDTRETLVDPTQESAAAAPEVKVPPMTSEAKATAIKNYASHAKLDPNHVTIEMVNNFARSFALGDCSHGHVRTRSCIAGNEQGFKVQAGRKSHVLQRRVQTCLVLLQRFPICENGKDYGQHLPKEARGCWNIQDIPSIGANFGRQRPAHCKAASPELRGYVHT